VNPYARLPSLQGAALSLDAADEGGWRLRTEAGDEAVAWLRWPDKRLGSIIETGEGQLHFDAKLGTRLKVWAADPLAAGQTLRYRGRLVGRGGSVVTAAGGRLALRPVSPGSPFWRLTDREHDDVLTLSSDYLTRRGRMRLALPVGVALPPRGTALVCLTVMAVLLTDGLRSPAGSKSIDPIP
jgi:hypothetical protein